MCGYFKKISLLRNVPTRTEHKTTVKGNVNTCKYCDIARKNKDVAHVSNTTMVGLPIKYCPMCGERLREDKNDEL